MQAADHIGGMIMHVRFIRLEVRSAKYTKGEPANGDAETDAINVYAS